MRMRKCFRISPQQSIHQASSDSENYEIKLGDRGEGLFGLILLVSSKICLIPPRLLKFSDNSPSLAVNGQ